MVGPQEILAFGFTIITTTNTMMPDFRAANSIIGSLFSSLVCVWYLVAKNLEKVMAPHCSTLAWKIPWMDKPGRLQFMGSRRVVHD